MRNLLGGAALAWTAILSAMSSAQDIVLGQSVALTGPAQALGREMRLGANVYFDQVNAAGGLRGRKIVLRTMYDLSLIHI